VSTVCGSGERRTDAISLAGCLWPAAGGRPLVASLERRAESGRSFQKGASFGTISWEK